MRMTLFALALTAVTALGAPPAVAGDVPVTGLKLDVSDPLPGKNPRQRELLVKARDRVGAPVTGDPRATGVTVEFFAAGDASSANQAFVVPGGAFQEPNGPGWSGSSVCRKRRFSDAPPRCKTRFTYTDERGDNGAVVSLRLFVYVGHWTRLSVQADGRGNNPTIDVTPPNPGTRGGAIVTIPNGSRICALFGGAAGGSIGTNTAEEFVIRRARAALCPPSTD